MTESTVTVEHKEAIAPPLDAIMVFGSGPVVDRQSREKAETANTPIGTEDINFWSHTLAQATDILLENNQTARVILMGGKTGGSSFKSEAELIAEAMQAKDSPKTPILLEDGSLNTLENLVNALNLYIDEPTQAESFKKLGLLAQHFHLPRVRLLMELFDIPYVTAFSSEKVVAFDAAQKGDMDTVADIDERLDLSQDPNSPDSYYGKKKGTERLDIKTRFLQNDAYTKEFFDYPEYWLCYVGKLSSEKRIRGILSKLDPEQLKKYHIDLGGPIDEVKSKLVAIERIDLPVADLMQIPWTEENIAHLDEVIDARTS